MSFNVAPGASPKKAIADLEKGRIWPIYYLYGEEPFKIHEFVDKIIKSCFEKDFPNQTLVKQDLAFNIDRFDGSTSSGSDILEAIQSLGLFGGGSKGRRIVLVRQANQLKKIEPLTEVLMSENKGSDITKNENILVLLADTLDGRKKFHQWLKKEGFAIEFKSANDTELLQWAQYLARKLGAEIEPVAAQMLVALCESSLYRLSQEIEKVWVFIGATKGSLIKVEHIKEVSSGDLVHEMIELVNAVLVNKKTRSLLLSEKIIRSSEEALGFVGFMTWALKNPGRGFVQQVAGGVRRAERILLALVELDLKLKTSGMEPLVLMERFIVEETDLTALSA